MLTPSRSKSNFENHNKKSATPEASKKSLHLLNKNNFLTESQREEILYMIVAINAESTSEPLEFSP